MIKLVLTLVLSLHSKECFALYHGEESNITAFSHATCLSVQSCEPNEEHETDWMCGSSILNQKILLTAAHCIHGCRTGSFRSVQFGSADRLNSSLVFVKNYIEHPSYEERPSHNDIALVLLGRSLKLSNSAGRIAIYPKKYTSYDVEGVVAGWGYIDDKQEIQSSKLHHATQRIMQPAECERLLGQAIPPGIICGGNDQRYVTKGDSGSALVVRNHVQVGIVSYKDPEASRSIAMYTDVGYYYE